MNFRDQRDPLGDKKSLVSLVDYMGSSLSIVNDARQSFDCKSQEWTDKDTRLLQYLAREKHTSPFRGVVFKFYVKCPLFIARQWWKHVIASTYVDDQLGWNEKSFRYCSADDAEFYVPKQFFKQSTSNRQASDGLVEEEKQAACLQAYEIALGTATAVYEDLIGFGVSKEQARAVLPPAMYTSFVWTCSLQALFHFISLRSGAGAQHEIGKYAEALFELGRPVAPEAFDVLKSNDYNF
jgi:thymidylate synthase (FAD)